MKTEAGEEKAGAASGTSETWSKTQLIKQDCNRHSEYRSEISVRTRGGWHIYLQSRPNYPDVRMNVYQRKSLRRVDILYLHTLLHVGLSLGRVDGMQRCWNLCLALCVF